MLPASLQPAFFRTIDKVGNYNCSPVLHDSNKALPTASNIPEQFFPL
jgi:hypothetical protein